MIGSVFFCKFKQLVKRKTEVLQSTDACKLGEINRKSFVSNEKKKKQK